jgi:hypothetical protein
MQKVVGSNPISRFGGVCKSATFGRGPMRVVGGVSPQHLLRFKVTSARVRMADTGLRARG